MPVELHFIQGPRAGDRVEVPAEGTLVVGRGAEASCRIEDLGLSRRHCEILWKTQHLLLRDLGSANGTFVNGQRVTEMALSPNDQIGMGGTIVRVDFRPGREAETVRGRICTRCGKTVEDLTSSAEPNVRYLCLECRKASEEDFHLPGFRTLGLLGQGGMGTVYLAEHEIMRRKVAIKILKQGHDDLEAVARFEREATTLSQLSHPNVVRFYPVVRQENRFFMVMEFCPGGTLMDRLNESGPIPIEDAKRIGIEIAGALTYIHEHGLVHRDVKPHNIFYPGGGKPAKLGDFGLAKETSRAGKSAITTPGTPLGTLGYIAPEQLRNALKADHRADIYGFGATFYHAVGGRRPFEGRSLQKIMVDILRNAPPPITDFRADCPESYARILDRCLAKDPAARYPTADDLAKALAAVEPPGWKVVG